MSATKVAPTPNEVLEHGIWHGVLSVWPQLLVMGVLILGLMVFVEFRRQRKAEP
jgi:hypothetical protein